MTEGCKGMTVDGWLLFSVANPQPAALAANELESSGFFEEMNRQYGK